MGSQDCLWFSDDWDIKIQDRHTKWAGVKTHTHWCLIVATYKVMVYGSIVVNLAIVHGHNVESQWVWIKDEYYKKNVSLSHHFSQTVQWSCIFIQSTVDTFTHSHTHSYTDGEGCHARRQLLIRSNLGFSILLKDTWQPGFEPDDPPQTITRWPALPTEP